MAVSKRRLAGATLVFPCTRRQMPALLLSDEDDDDVRVFDLMRPWYHACGVEVEAAHFADRAVRTQQNAARKALAALEDNTIAGAAKVPSSENQLDSLRREGSSMSSASCVNTRAIGMEAALP